MCFIFQYSCLLAFIIFFGELSYHAFTALKGMCLCFHALLKCTAFVFLSFFHQYVKGWFRLCLFWLRYVEPFESVDSLLLSILEDSVFFCFLCYACWVIYSVLFCLFCFFSSSFDLVLGLISNSGLNTWYCI